MIKALTGLHQFETSLDDALHALRPRRCGISPGDLALSFVKDGGEVQFEGSASAMTHFPPFFAVTGAVVPILPSACAVCRTGLPV